jgi:L-glutamine-phosphate cytidylyltransferase
MRMIILAAGQGTRLRPLTDDRPKCLVDLAGRPLLEWTIETARAAGVTDIVVIGGYRMERLAGYGVKVLANPDFASTNMVRTLFCAESCFGDGFVMSYGDIAYTPDVLRQLLADPAPIAVTVDRGWRAYWEQRFDEPLADAETLVMDEQGFITDIGQKARSLDAIQAQYIGLAAFRGAGVRALVDAYRDAQTQESGGRSPFDGARSLDKLYMTDLLQGLISRGDKLKAVKIDRGWVEIDSVRDLEIAEKIVRAGGLDAAS